MKRNILANIEAFPSASTVVLTKRIKPLNTAGTDVDQSEVIVDITRSIIIGGRTIRIPSKGCLDAATFRWNG